MDNSGNCRVESGHAMFWAKPQTGGFADPDVSPPAGVPKHLSQHIKQALLAFAPEAATKFLAAFPANDDDGPPRRRAGSDSLWHCLHIAPAAWIDNREAVRDAVSERKRGNVQ